VPPLSECSRAALTFDYCCMKLNGMIPLQPYHSDCHMDVAASFRLSTLPSTTVSRVSTTDTLARPVSEGRIVGTHVSVVPEHSATITICRPDPQPCRCTTPCMPYPSRAHSSYAAWISSESVKIPRLLHRIVDRRCDTKAVVPVPVVGITALAQCPRLGSPPRLAPAPSATAPAKLTFDAVRQVSSGRRGCGLQDERDF
jgi:hypothetical protein